jgi:signal transduction histidine kinase
MSLLADKEKLLEISQRVSEDLVNTSETEETAFTLVESVNESFSFSGSIFYRSEGGKLESYASHPEVLLNSAPLNLVIKIPALCPYEAKANWSIKDCSECGQCQNYLAASALRKEVIIYSRADDGLLDAFLPTQEACAKEVIILPIKSRDRLYGVLALFSKKDEAITPSEEFCLSVIANSAALAFYGQDLFQILEAIGQEEARGEMARDVVHTLTPTVSSLSIGISLLRKGVEKLVQQALQPGIDRQTLKNTAVTTTLRLDTFTEGHLHQKNLLTKYEAISSGMQELADIDVLQVVKDVVSLNNSRAMSKRVTIVTRVKGTPRPLSGLEVDLHLILWNLINNAIKFTRGGRPSKVYINIVFAEKSISVAVRDEGVGIREEDRASIWRLGYSTVAPGEEHKTSGIGLATVNHLVRNLAGDVQVRSKVNSYSEFTITIPQ